jgi:hypothetical protein
MAEWRHGTYSRYFRGGCRCPECVAYQRSRVARNRAERVEAGRLNHGTRSAYDAGCRCPACRARRVRAYLLEKYRVQEGT